MEKILEKIGLSEKEAKVYLAALELGQDTVQNIAKKAEVNRPTAYFILEKLMELGLVSTLEQGKKTFFVAENPKELESLLDRERQQMETRKLELKESMNQLLAIYNAKEGKPTVRYFEGADGLEVMDRYGRGALKKNTEILSIIPIDTVEKQFADRRKKSLNERVKLGIKARAIYTHDDGPIPESVNKANLRDGIFIPREKFPLDAAVTIYPEWGIKLYYYDPHKPYGVVIESAALAKNFKFFFELAWLGAKTLK